MVIWYCTIYSKNTDESLDDWRRVWTNADESQTNLDECSPVQTSLDKLDSLILENVTHGPNLLQVCNSRPHRYGSFQFCSFICGCCFSQCAHSPYQPICLLFHLIYLNLNWTDAQKSSQEKREVSLHGK